MIRYQDTRTGSVKVYLERAYVGSIVKNGTGWHYQPKGRGNRPGCTMTSIDKVKQSLATPPAGAKYSVNAAELAEEQRYKD